MSDSTLQSIDAFMGVPKVGKIMAQNLEKAILHTFGVQVVLCINFTNTLFCHVP